MATRLEIRCPSKHFRHKNRAFITPPLRTSLVQDLWLKMHSGDGLARSQGDLAQLLRLYRSASLEVIEDMMRHPELEKIADSHSKKKV